MLPTLAQGDYVIALRWWWSLQVGDLVIARHPLLPFLVKRIKAIDKHGDLLLHGDSKESLSPEKMGTIPRDQVLGESDLPIQGLKSVCKGIWPYLEVYHQRF